MKKIFNLGFRVSALILTVALVIATLAFAEVANRVDGLSFALAITLAGAFWISSIAMLVLAVEEKDTSF